MSFLDTLETPATLLPKRVKLSLNCFKGQPWPYWHRQRHAALAVDLYKLMGHKIEDACDFVSEEIGVDAGTIKNWCYKKPLDYTKTRDDYKSMFSGEMQMIRLYKRLIKSKDGGKASAPRMGKMLQLHLKFAKNYQQKVTIIIAKVFS